MESFKVRVSKDYLSFCAAHFILYNGTQCERLHGHNYRVSAEIEGTLDDDYLVFDFISLKGILREICAELDHRTLIPLRSKVFSIETSDTSVRMQYEDREWVFPRDDCCLLPIENSTAELLARWISGKLVEELTPRMSTSTAILEKVTIEVEESPGQCALYEASSPVLTPR